jgi:superfamily II DNA or RNA helicase
VGSTGVLQKCKIQSCHGEYKETTDKYFNYGKKGYKFCEIGLMLYNLSEHQIEALSNMLRGIDCFISQPTGSGKSAVYQFIFPFAFT